MQLECVRVCVYIYIIYIYIYTHTHSIYIHYVYIYYTHTHIHTHTHTHTQDSLEGGGRDQDNQIAKNQHQKREKGVGREKFIDNQQVTERGGEGEREWREGGRELMRS